MNLKSTFLLLFILFVLKNQCSLLDETFVAVEKVIAYYSLNVHKMILDGVFGLRYFEGQFLALKKFAKENKTDILKDSYFLRMKILAGKAKKISLRGVENLRIKHQEYFKKVGWLVLNPYFNANFSFKHVAYQPPETPILWHSFDNAEDIIDTCFSDVTQNAPAYDINLHKLQSSSTSHCVIKRPCLELALNMKTGGYILTHQLILIQIYLMVGCGEIIEAMLPDSMTTGSLIGALCTMMLHEMSMYYKNYSFIPSNLEDLFAEQTFICSSNGYYEFLHADWLKQFIECQLPIGCFVWDNKKFTSRKLLKDATMDDTCSNHKTTVVFSALTQYISTLILANHGVISFNGLEKNVLPSINYIKNPHLLLNSNHLSVAEGLSTKLQTFPERKKSRNFLIILLFFIFFSFFILRKRLFSAIYLLSFMLRKTIYRK